jgi:methionyl-tRNA synthetase
MTRHLFLKLWEHELIREEVTTQIYSLEDQRYLPDRFITGTCPHCGYEAARGDQCENCTRLLDPADLLEARSSISGSTRLEKRESKHLYLDLPKIAGNIDTWLDAKDHWPKTALSIARKWLNEGLKARCITRDLKWGVPVPLEGYKDKVFYVWFDAPIGYIGISMEWAREKGDPELWASYWKDPETRLVQFMAKDNVPFHTVTWPAVMMGADDGFILADMIKGFEWLNYEKGKFSTSLQRGLFTDDALKIFPADYWRYYLVKIAPEKGDTDFSWQGFLEAVNKDLADVLGNFVNRVLTLLQKYFDGVVGEASVGGAPEKKVAETIEDLVDSMSRCRFQMTLRRLRDFWQYCNRYVDETAPYKVVKTSREEAGKILSDCVYLIRSSAIMSSIFIPHLSQAIFQNLGLEQDVSAESWESAAKWHVLKGHKIPGKPKILVPKIEEDAIAPLRERFSGDREPSPDGSA